MPETAIATHRGYTITRSGDYVYAYNDAGYLREMAVYRDDLSDPLCDIKRRIDDETDGQMGLFTGRIEREKMVAYNFQARFAELVRDGKKRQTIRAYGNRRHARPGERLQLYTGMRTKVCRKLVNPDPVCIGVSEIVIDDCDFAVFLDDQKLDPVDVHGLAIADGFNSVVEMREWFESTHSLPFHGLCIKWAD